MATVIIPQEYIIDYRIPAENKHPKHSDVGFDVKSICRIERMYAGHFCTRLFFIANDHDHLLDIDLSVPEVCALIADALKGR